jgi:hypothetical protein
MYTAITPPGGSTKRETRDNFGDVTSSIAVHPNTIPTLLNADVTLLVIAFWTTDVSEARRFSSSPVRVASKKAMSCLITAWKV